MLAIASVSQSLQTGRDEHVAEHVRIRLGDMYGGSLASLRRRRVAACRSIGAPRALSRIGRGPGAYRPVDSATGGLAAAYAVGFLFTPTSRDGLAPVVRG